MGDQKDKKTDELIKDLEGMEVTELDDKELEGAAGGLAGDCNCGCAAGAADAALSDGNCNCGC
ncbi:MAG TPA: hypothetical protein VGG03_21830 [Thermoanaerobaculia bacterium]|jgi:hypothetical protein